METIDDLAKEAYIVGVLGVAKAERLRHVNRVRKSP